MTCSKDCNTCIYGVPAYRYECGDPNSTCNGECYNCIHKIILGVKWYCNVGLAYGAKGGITQ